MEWERDWVKKIEWMRMGLSKENEMNEKGIE